MIRVLIFLGVVFLLGVGFAWLADRPGNLVVTFGGYQYQVSLMVAALAVTAIIAATMIAWWLVKAIWNSPYTVARYFRVRKRDRGYQALSTGMIAAGAGDGELARKMNKQAAKLIRADTEPLLHLLDAQATLIEGDHEAARRKFERMLDDPETRLLGLRGLFLEAQRLDDPIAARHYAARAAEVAPQLRWAVDATVEERASRGDWDGALQLVEGRTARHQADRDLVSRRRAVLLTAKATDLIDTDPAAAKAAALEAVRLQPHFPPAVQVAARLLFRQGDVRKGSKLIETAWKAEPHPDLVDLYIRARPADAALDRLARARRLESLHPNHPESSLAVARAALDAHEFAVAREAAQAALRMQPREAGWLLLADIEEADSGNQGRVKQYLAKAMRAPRDPAWVADGYVSDRWAPVSPVTGRIDAFEWRPPVERIGQVIDQSDMEDEAATPVLAAPDSEEPPLQIAEDQPIRIDDGAEMPAPGSADGKAVVEADVGGRTAGQDVVGAAPATGEAATATHGEAGGKPVAAEDEVAAVPDTPPPLPDDPGIEPIESEEKVERRFRLF